MYLVLTLELPQTSLTILSGPFSRAVQGDSGGPLTVEEDGVHTLAGVVRGGAAGNCSEVRGKREKE